MRRWQHSLLAVGASAVAAFLRWASNPANRLGGPGERSDARRQVGSAHKSNLRAAAVDFISDVLAETYRKLRAAEQLERHRK